MLPKRDGCLSEVQRKTLLGVKINGIEHARSGGKGHDLLEYYFIVRLQLAQLGQSWDRQTNNQHSLA